MKRPKKPTLNDKVHREYVVHYGITAGEITEMVASGKIPKKAELYTPSSYDSPSFEWEGSITEEEFVEALKSYHRQYKKWDNTRKNKKKLEAEAEERAEERERQLLAELKAKYEK